MDVTKIHKRSGKVTLLCYDDFENRPLPQLLTRIKVNLKTQAIDVFDHRALPRQQLLYFKERNAAPGHPRRPERDQFSARLRALGLNELIGYGPTRQELLTLLDEKNPALADRIGRMETANP